MNMFHHSLYRQHNSKIVYLNKTRLDSSCLNDQAILLEYNTLKGVYQIVYQLVRWGGVRVNVDCRFWPKNDCRM